MMKELSMHIQDIAENSVRGGGSEIQVTIKEDTVNNVFQFIIKDNGRGIEESVLKDIKNPFTTTRKFRKVGLGIPFLNEACETCGGSLSIISQLNVGTEVNAVLKHNHIDRPPLGNIVDTMTGLITSYPTINFIFAYNYNDNDFSISTKEIQEVLGDDVSLNQYEILSWLKNTLKESIEELK